MKGKINPMTIKKIFAAAVAAGLAAAAARAETVVNVEGTGAEKLLVSIDVGGNAAFQRSLARNLQLSGAFRLVKGDAPIKVTGGTGSQIVVQGRGKKLTLPSTAADDKAARTEARQLADAMCEKYAGQKGFASDKLVFVKKNARAEELCTGYADGGDIRQVTQDGMASVGPRWKDRDTVFYTGYLNNAPQVFELNVATGRRRMAWGFGGLTTGATISPDGAKAAIILSKPFGNPELCTIDISRGTWQRLTTTRAASEGQPTWSPDGRKIAYVSDESRNQHLYIVDVASREKRRLTSLGRQNVDPDWGKDGRLVYITKRGGTAQVAVVDPAEGDKAAKLVTKPGNWEHPTWARDMRHVVAECDGRLYIVDTADGAEEPVLLFSVQSGRCMTPSWYR